MKHGKIFKISNQNAEKISYTVNTAKMQKICLGNEILESKSVSTTLGSTPAVKEGSQKNANQYYRGITSMPSRLKR